MLDELKVDKSKVFIILSKADSTHSERINQVANALGIPNPIVISSKTGHILLVGPPGQAKTLFLKSILEAFGEKRAFFTVGGNASKSGMRG